MITRSQDIGPLLSTMWRYLPLAGFEPDIWINDDKNIALTDNKGNFSLFEYNLPGVYTGHWFFPYARGRQAINLANEMLDEIFAPDKYDVKIIRGLTPLQNLGARWLARQVGFKSHGVTQTEAGPCELFILSRREL